MGEGGRHVEPEGLRAALRGYDLHCVVLGAMTALGLFFLGGVRDPVSWVAFGVATVLVVVAVRKRLASVSMRSASVSSIDEPIADLVSAERESDEAGAVVRASEPALDEVDYLRALRHELRTPLNAVLGFADVLLNGIDGRVNSSQREDLEIIRASGIRLRILLDCALDLSQLADDELRLDIERVDVRELTRRAASEARQLWPAGRELRCELPEQPLLAQADEARIRRSILVLADFLATTHRNCAMSISLASSGEHYSVEVSADTAEELTLEALPSTAEVLAAEDVSKIRQWPVAVTSELVGRHDGSLYHGVAPSRFLLRFPLRGTA